MKTLAIDTSSKICGVCILENKTLINKIDLNNGLTHSESLMPLIKEVLEKANLKLSDIDNIVCDIGPGSFTGIRIGVATAMAFVDSLNLKYTGVTSLEALAYNINTQGLICSIIDAKNENCYYALYKLESGNYKELIEPTATTISNMLDTLKKYTEQINDIFIIPYLHLQNLPLTASYGFFITKKSTNPMAPRPQNRYFTCATRGSNPGHPD